MQLIIRMVTDIYICTKFWLMKRILYLQLVLQASHKFDMYRDEAHIVIKTYSLSVYS